jgi:serine O-acetyltransferase
VTRPTSRRSELARLREDWQLHGPASPLKNPAFHVLAIYRLSRALGDSRGVTTFPLRSLRLAAGFLSQTLYGVELPWQTRIGRRLRIGHIGGIVISPLAVIGDDCIILQNVTIGTTDRHARAAPRIGNGVQIGSGAVVVGDLTIGDGARIGPNAVVTTDVPAGARVTAPSSRVVSLRDGGPRTQNGRVDLVTPELVLAVVRETLNQADDILDADVPLLSSGLVDSLNLVALIDALEARLGVSIPTDVVDVEHFDTPRVIADTLSAGRR